MRWSRSPQAVGYLCVLSFAESSFFPVPPDVMLVPMTLAQPMRWFYLASATTICSVLGGALGYIIGALAFNTIAFPLLTQTHALHHYQTVSQLFEQWGLWLVFIAGVSPIPYKLLTLSAGALAMPFLPFMIVSFIGRGLRFYSLSYLIAYGGHKLAPRLQRKIDVIGCIVGLLILMLLFVFIYKL